MAAFDGRFFQRRPLFSQAASFASEAMWVSHLFLNSGHIASKVAIFDGCLCQRRPLLMAAFVNGGHFAL
jgi:hypothetical protein